MAILATDFRYIEQARTQAPEYQVRRVTGDVSDWLPGLAAELGLGEVAFEAACITVAQHNKLIEALDKAKSGMRLTPLDGLVESLRAVKEPEEIRFIKQAAELANSTYELIEAGIRPGMTEKEVAWELEKALRQKGSQAVPFEIIVASGPNAALPHARPTSRAIGAGEPVVIDMGARVGGYCSDLSRTICSGKRDGRFEEIYHIVLQAQQAAIAAIKAGATGESVDAAAREVIKSAGYGKAFGHGLGHGVGLVPHELPHVAPNSKEPLVDGMIFTVEPGIYLPGWGGVRIEDLVLMESGQAHVLSQEGGFK